MDAEAFFEYLFANGYVQRFAWKNINRQTTKYRVSFDCVIAPVSYHTIEVNVIGGKHTIKNSAAARFFRMHKKQGD